MSIEITYACSLGFFCHTAELLKRQGYKLESYPFDWIFSDIDMVTNCIEDNFQTLLDKTKYVTIKGKESERCCGHISYKLNCFNHIDPLNNVEDYDYLLRCVSRFTNLLKRKEGKLFIILYNNDKNENITEFMEKINNLNKSIKQKSDNYNILCVLYKVSETLTHNIIKNDNVIICNLYTTSKSTGRRFVNECDNIYFDKFLNDTYTFKVKPLATNLAIIIDKFSGHLFHDLELYIVAFNLIKEILNKEIHIFFIKTDCSSQRFFEPNKYGINKTICKKIFNTELISTVCADIDHPFPNKYDILIDRKKLKTHNINKAFASSIINFPSYEWALNIGPIEKKTTGFNIIYSNRQKTNRKLSEDSENYLKELIFKYNGSIFDPGEFTIEKQIEIFRNADCVIGLHGNNLSGIMWMKPHSFVFEILPYNKKNIVYDYHCMSLCMKHNYTQIDCFNGKDTLTGIFDIDKNSKYLLENTLKMCVNINKEF
jgi:hypothetical protein